MRIHSTYEVNTHHQQNPFVSQTAGSASTGKTAQGQTFAECFHSCFPQITATPVVGKAESQITGIFWGFYPGLKMQPKSEPTLKGSAT